MKITGIETLRADAGWRMFPFSGAPQIDNGELVLPTAPGWGIDVNEKAVRARPPKN